MYVFVIYLSLRVTHNFIGFVLTSFPQDSDVLHFSSEETKQREIKNTVLTILLTL